MYAKTSYALAASILLLTVTAASSKVAVDNPPTPPEVLPTEGGAGEISLAGAVERALACNAGLSASDLEVKAAEARAHQAGMVANPELEFELENFAGTDELKGFDGTETSISVAQPFHLGGDRARRKAVADAKVRLALGAVELRRRDLVYQTTAAFFRLIAAQQEQVLTRDLLDLAKRLERTVEARVEAGKVSPVELTRARIETVRAEVALSGMQHRLREARARLAANWNKTELESLRAAGGLPSPGGLPPYRELERRLLSAPELEMMRLHQEIQTSSIELEKALAIPDIRVMVGSRRFRGTGQSAWLAGVSVPIPLFDRNQGGREAAEFELERSRRTSQTVDAEQRLRLRTVVEQTMAAEKALTSMTELVEPAAADAFAAVEIGYLQGKFAFSDLLLAQQSLFESRRLVLKSHLDFALARCELERLVGPLSQLHNAAASVAGEN